jgi:Asp-tRNA(Asn)/Glu-tRNA(Gln) amidotransferase A subunit family amidase
MTRCVEDAALLFSVIADTRAMADPAASGNAALKRGIVGLRLAVPRRRELGTVEPSVYDAFAAACDIFRSLGARVDEIDLPQEYFGSAAEMQTIISAEAYSSTATWIEADGPALIPMSRRASHRARR